MANFSRHCMQLTFLTLFNVEIYILSCVLLVEHYNNLLTRDFVCNMRACAAFVISH